MPVGNYSARTGGDPGRSVFAVDDAELVLVVTEAKLDVGGVVGGCAFEVGSDA
jgi:hypothetical protein